MRKNYTQYSDYELIELMKGNQEEQSNAFSTLYDRHEAMLRAYCNVVLNDKFAAEDILQETFIRFYKSLLEEKDFSNVPGYLMTIAKNLCLNTKRNAKNNQSIEDMDFKGDDGVGYENKELLELIIMSLEFLEEKYRRAFMLREFQGLSHKEIAEQENITLANAKLRVTRAKQKVIKTLEPYINDISKNLK